MVFEQTRELHSIRQEYNALIEDMERTRAPFRLESFGPVVNQRVKKNFRLWKLGRVPYGGLWLHTSAPLTSVKTSDFVGRVNLTERHFAKAITLLDRIDAHIARRKTRHVGLEAARSNVAVAIAHLVTFLAPAELGQKLPKIQEENGRIVLSELPTLFDGLTNRRYKEEDVIRDWDVANELLKERQRRLRSHSFDAQNVFKTEPYSQLVPVVIDPKKPLFVIRTKK